MIIHNPRPGNEFSTWPLMRHYAELRAESDALLAFEMGDFFEFYGDDAVIVSRVLDIALSCRGDVPMCGFPVGLDGNPRNNDSLVVALTSSQHSFLALALALAGHAVSVAMQKEVVDGVMQRVIIGRFEPPGEGCELQAIS
jgi:hypothetical protein